MKRTTVIQLSAAVMIAAAAPLHAQVASKKAAVDTVKKAVKADTAKKKAGKVAPKGSTKPVPVNDPVGAGGHPADTGKPKKPPTHPPVP